MVYFSSSIFSSSNLRITELLKNPVGFLALLALFCQPVLTSAAQAVEIPRVPWLEDVPFDEVVNQAQAGQRQVGQRQVGQRQAEQGQPILVDFYAQWCAPCKLLDVMVYNEREVIAELADVLTFKVDIDKPEYLELKKRFNITILPTLVWLDSRGRELDRFTGYQNKEEFLGLVRTIREGGDTFFRMIDRQNLRPEDPGLLCELARRHGERGDLTRADILYRRLMGLRFKADRSVVTDGMLGLAAMEQKAGRMEQARGLARRAAAVFGEPDSSAAASLMAVAEFQYSLEDTAGVLETYRKLIELDDTDPWALVGYMRAATMAGRDLEQATKYGLRAVVYSSNDPQVMASLARCYAAREYFHKAKRWMQKVVAKESGNEEHRKALEEYERELEKRPYLFRGRRR